MEKQRLQFDVTPDTLAAIEDLKRESGATTRAEVFRKALKLYALTLKRIAEGYELQFKKDSGEVREVDIL